MPTPEEIEAATKKREEDLKKREDALAAKEEEDKKRARTHDPHSKTSDATPEFLKEWDGFKKQNPALFAAPTPPTVPPNTPPKVKAHNNDKCVFGGFCPFPALCEAYE